MQLEAITRLMPGDPLGARDKLAEVMEVLAEQQRELRTWVGQLRSPARAGATPAELAAALDKLGRRAEWHHGVHVEVRVALGHAIPRDLADHVYRIVQESLTNVGRHAKARIARVNVRTLLGRVHVDVTDDGVGFPFRGEFELDDLVRRQVGPASLRDRVCSLGGRLRLCTGPSGSHLDIALPIRDPT
jgi:signal transduction histidine kinase